MGDWFRPGSYLLGYRVRGDGMTPVTLLPKDHTLMNVCMDYHDHLLNSRDFWNWLVTHIQQCGSAPDMYRWCWSFFSNLCGGA